MSENSISSTNLRSSTERLSFFEKVGFASGDAACNMLFNPITMFLSFFIPTFLVWHPVLWPLSF